MLIKKSPMRQDNFKLNLIELKEGGRGKTHLHMVSNKKKNVKNRYFEAAGHIICKEIDRDR